MNIWYHLAKSIVGVYLRIAHIKIDISGQKNIPPEPKIIVPNHPNSTDAFMLPFIFKDKLHFMMQAELLTLPIMGRILALAGQIPVERGRGRIALEHAIRKIREGYSVVVFPEGILTGTHELKRIGTGVARLAAKTGAPCIPVGFHIPSKFIRVIHKRAYGRDTVGGWQFGGRCFVTIGEPMRVTVDKGAEIKAPFYREFTTNLLECVYALADHSRARSGEPAVLQYHPPTLTEVN